MQKDKSWNLLNKQKINSEKDLIEALLENRGIRTRGETEGFLSPSLKTVTVKSVGIDERQLDKAIAGIRLAIKNKEQIVVFGDYDVDGIAGTAILWETLNSLGANVFPYIPHRIEEGYGLSETGIKNLKLKIKNCALIITVDNGIVANSAVDFAKKQGIDVIVTDHHVFSGKLPKASAIVHTTKLCGTGVAYLLSRVILNEVKNLNQKRDPSAMPQDDNRGKSHLELVALATVADLVPLKETNRTLLKFGLEALKNTKRVGLLELFNEAGIDKEKIGVYEIGHIIAPRLNATGRLDYAMDSLRLICTNNQKRAERLSKEIGLTNKERQLLTIQTTEHAIELVKNKKELKKLLLVVHESYQQGVIGLVAGKLVEEFYRPAIVISMGKKFSKASARSIKGFNIIEFIRTASEFLVDAGGHPMAAGFTIETEKIPILEEFINSKIGSLIDEQSLIRKLKIDCEIPLSFIDLDLYESLQKFAPFGMGNPEPTFLSKNVMIEDIRLVGMEGKHLKLRLGESRIKNQELRRNVFDGIGFGMGERASELYIGDKISIVYTIEQDEWNGGKRLQLKIKDFRRS